MWWCRETVGPGCGASTTSPRTPCRRGSCPPPTSRSITSSPSRSPYRSWLRGLYNIFFHEVIPRGAITWTQSYIYTPKPSCWRAIWGVSDIIFKCVFKNIFLSEVNLSAFVRSRDICGGLGDFWGLRSYSWTLTPCCRSACKASTSYSSMRAITLSKLYVN